MTYEQRVREEWINETGLLITERTVHCGNFCKVVRDILRDRLALLDDSVEAKVGRFFMDGIEAFHLAKTDPDMAKTQMADSFIRVYQEQKQKLAATEAKLYFVLETLETLARHSEGRCVCHDLRDFNDDEISNKFGEEFSIRIQELVKDEEITSLKAKLAEYEREHRAIEWMNAHPNCMLSIIPDEKEGEFLWAVDDDANQKTVGCGKTVVESIEAAILAAEGK